MRKGKRYMKIVIFNEGLHEKEDWMKAVYPEGIHGALKAALQSEENEIKIVTQETIGDINEEFLNNTDVMLWWGHAGHHLVPDNIAQMVQTAVLKGMGFIALHSAHYSKPFKLLMGTSCSLCWRDDDRERVWTVNPTHPIAAGLPAHFELPKEEMYGEVFDIPKPDDVVFIGWFEGGEVFRSGCTFTRGRGKVFYFQPGHEAFPTYYNENIVKILQNAVKWAAPAARISSLDAPWVPRLEK